MRITTLRAECTICIFIISGVCLFLKKAKSVMDSYDCRVFKYGCPTGPYFGSTVYKCKNSISYQIPVEDFQKNEFYLFRLIVNYKKNKGDKKVITKGLFEKFYVSVFGSEPNLYHSLIISLPAKRRHIKHMIVYNPLLSFSKKYEHMHILVIRLIEIVSK